MIFFRKPPIHLIELGVLLICDGSKAEIVRSVEIWLLKLHTRL